MGKAAEKKLAAAVFSYKKILAVEGWRGPWTLPERYLSAAEETAPHLVEELRGMAAGSRQSFGDLFFLNALEEALEYKDARRCTAVAVSIPGGLLLGHNEDWYGEDADHVIVVQARPAGKPAFLSVTAAPFLAAVGINEAGLAQGVNSVSSLDSGPGLPRMFAARGVLEAETLQDAIGKAIPRGRAGGYNHLLAVRTGEIGNLESSAGAHHYSSGGQVVFHTNHYVSPEMLPFEKGASSHSLARYRRLEQLKDGLAAAAHPCGVLAAVLRDHYNRPSSICNHATEQTDCQGTIFSAIFDLQNLKAWVAVGNPCRNRYQLLSFAVNN